MSSPGGIPGKTPSIGGGVPDEPIDQIYGCIIILSSALAFQIIGWLVTSQGAPQSVPPHKEYDYKNLVISWIHGFITGVWSLLAFIIYPQILDDPIAFNNPFTYAMTAVSTGYFIYDFIDNIRNRSVKSKLEILLHHIFVSLMFMYNLFTNTCVGYVSFCLLAEVNSIFLHGRKLLQVFQVDYNSLLYKINVWLNLLTFVFFRFVAMFSVLIGMYIFGHRVPTVYFYTLTVSAVFVSPMQIVLFWRLVKSDILRKKKSTKSQPKASINGDNNNVNVTKNGCNGLLNGDSILNGESITNGNGVHIDKKVQ